MIEKKLKLATIALATSISTGVIAQTNGATFFIKSDDLNSKAAQTLQSELSFQPGKILPGIVALKQLKENGLLDEQANDYGIEVGELERILKTDPSVLLDSKGQIFYKEAKPFSFSASNFSQTINSTELNDHPASEAFNLNSRPGSTKVIYLNFKGARITNTSWNDSYQKAVIDTAPFDTDSNPSSFSESERIEIINRWRLVAEAFSQYDINVTTVEQPQENIFRTSAADQNYGVIAHITPDWTQQTTDPCRCGGFAYLSAFSGQNNRIRDNFNFNWANSNNARGSSGTIIHEVGHNLGLNHDGTPTAVYYSGHGSGEHTWAPYMGNGYYSEVAHFNNGDYPNATNQEDDFAIMQSRGAIPVQKTTMVVSSDRGVSEFNSRAILNSGNYEYHFLIAAGAGTGTWTLKPSKFGRSVSPTITVTDEDTGLVLYSKPENTSRTHSFVINSPTDKTYRMVVSHAAYKTPTTGGYSAYGSSGEFILQGKFSAPTDDAFIYSSDEKFESLTKYFEFEGDRPAGDGSETYVWKFSDGTGYRGKRIKKQFVMPGHQTLTLTVTTKSGYVRTTTKNINVMLPMGIAGF